MNTQATTSRPKTLTGCLTGNILETETGQRYKIKEIFLFDELSDEAKERAIEKLWNINVDYNWWQWIYEDAEEIGLEITCFDLKRRRYNINGKLLWSGEDVSKKILKNHGDSCETYKIAKQYLGKLLAIKLQWDEESVEYEEGVEELKQWFEKELLNAYWDILEKNYEYLTGKESIRETIEANEYEFDEDGNLV